MSCHTPGGSGAGAFTVAGTVYNQALSDISPNGSVKLYSGANASGTLLMTVAVDGKGNFFTTEPVDFGPGIYTLVTSADGNTRHMISTITSGACNACHGGSTARIWVD